MWCLTAAAGSSNTYCHDIRDSTWTREARGPKEIPEDYDHEFDEEKARLLAENEILTEDGDACLSAD